jgi:hypothetical protein
VVADSLDGNRSQFVEPIEKQTGKTYFLVVSSDGKCGWRMAFTIFSTGNHLSGGSETNQSK